MKTKKTLAVCSLAMAVAVAPIASDVNAQIEIGIGGLLGGFGGGPVIMGGGSTAEVVGAIVGVAMATILQQLSEQELANRQASLQQAARKGSSSWTSRRAGGKRPTRATYRKVGKVNQVGGQKCQQVRETITLPDGKQGTSVENVCFS